MSQYIHILNADGTVKNTIVASPEFAEAQYPGMWRVAVEYEASRPPEAPKQ